MIISCLVAKQILLDYFEWVLEPKFSATRLGGQWAGSFGLLAVSAQRTATPLVIAQLVEPVVGLLVGLAAELEISELGGH
jgi:hypothetical protein